ncbi:cysteine desulfurase [Kosmotoga arenicorallina S304]|uniref:Cysteine desulfurase n=1 Tax=Kosmotoga arenicorallina S304 TaxID=1453497 RepID=A0A176JWF9_9BACT|nr:cysteine desulfurase family protein [Kosmotoga arenicorallina]OAA28019.1 cysteine desulfurase [Kosmotoga arenicorallina S304]
MIYLDNNATTILDKEAGKAMMECFYEIYGNPNSIHPMGLEAHKAMEESREKIADLLKADPREIYFTSSATESINWALRSATSFRGKRKRVITSAIEHKAVLNTLKDLQNSEGIEVILVEPDRHGVVSAKEFLKHVNEDTYLVSLMAVNNVTGAIQPYKEIGRYLQGKDIFYHIDAVQTIGKLPFTFEDFCTFASFSAHKFHGPKGVGILYVKRGTSLRPLLTGGGQERGMRSSTQNVPGIVGTAVAMENAIKELNNKTVEKLASLRDHIVKAVYDLDGVVNTPLEHSIPNTLNISIPGIKGETLVNALASKGICIGTSSACSSRGDSGQYVLKAMKVKEHVGESAVRISMSRFTTETEVEDFIKTLREITMLLKF